MTLANEIYKSPNDNEPQPHMIPTGQREPYAAVPLNGWNAYEVDPEDPNNTYPYTIGSLDRIKKKTDLALKRLGQYEWANAELAETLRELIEVSLIDSQFQRIDRNAMIGTALSDDDPRVVDARQGTASPSELLAILADYPGLGSIELAKLSHPLDAFAAGGMDRAINEMIVRSFGRADIQPAYYKTKTVIDGLPVITVLRKQQVARSDNLAVVRRQAFLVRADEEAILESGLSFLDRRIQREERRVAEVYPLIEKTLPLFPASPHLKWLQPLATSYYAKDLTVINNPRSGAKRVARHGE